MQEHECTQNDEQELRRYCTPNTCSVCRIFLLHERCGGIDASDGSEKQLHAVRNTASRVGTDIIRLEGYDGGQVGVAAAHPKENSKVARAGIRRVRSDEEAHERDSRVSDHPRHS